MGKRRDKKRESDSGAGSSSRLHTSLSLREEASGRKQSHNPKSLLKLKHLQNVAEWASGEGSVPSLGAFFGSRFAEFGETLGVLPDPSFFPCQRCETLLRPGFNCTVRIEKNLAKRRRRSGKTHQPTQNNAVYTCNFCSHRNLRRGTPKGHLREICPPKTNFPSKFKVENRALERSDNAEKSNTNKVENLEALETPSSLPSSTSNITSSFINDNQVMASGVKLLDSKRSKRKKLGAKGPNNPTLVGSAPIESRNASDTGTSKNKRKSWTSLKEIAESEEIARNQRFKKPPIPFHL